MSGSHSIDGVLFTAAQAAEEIKEARNTEIELFTAAQAAEEVECKRCVWTSKFTAAQAAEELRLMTQPAC